MINKEVYISSLAIFRSNKIIGSYRPYSSNLGNQNLDPYYITGFADAEGCFQINISKNDKYRTGFNIIPFFSIHLHVKDIALLNNIQSYFGVGIVHEDKIK